MNGFEETGLGHLVIRNLNAIGYRDPRPIQAQAIGPILDGRDVIGLAQTGTGKTAAFAAPLIHHLLEDKPPKTRSRKQKQATRGWSNPADRLRALVLCPTRELAQQVAHEIGQIAQGSVLRVGCAYGKVGMQAQAELIASGIDVLVATPGRILELLNAGKMSLATIRFVTIDEADRMLDMGFLPQVSRILQDVPGHPQTLLFSATLPTEIEQLAQRFLVGPVRVEIGRHTTTVGHIGQRAVLVLDRDKVSLLIHLLDERQQRGTKGGVLVFCRTRRRVGWVGTALRRNGNSIGMIHGDRTQPQRQRTLKRFVDGEIDVLIATDVASRGLHIPTARTAINYDLPVTAEDFVHRVGRAAHGGGSGDAITLVTPREEDVWNVMSQTTGVEVELEIVRGFAPPTRRPSDTADEAREEKPRSGRGRRGKRGHEKSIQTNRSGRIVRRGRPGRGGGTTERPGGGVRRPKQP